MLIHSELDHSFEILLKINLGLSFLPAPSEPPSVWGFSAPESGRLSLNLKDSNPVGDDTPPAQRCAVPRGLPVLESYAGTYR